MPSADEARAAELLERLLTDGEFRASFRRNPASACAAFDLQDLAREFGAGGTGGKSLHTLEIRESRSSLAGALMAAASEGSSGVESLRRMHEGSGLSNDAHRVVHKALTSPKLQAVSDPSLHAGAGVHENLLSGSGTGTAAGGAVHEATAQSVSAVLDNHQLTLSPEAHAALVRGGADQRLVDVLDTLSRDHQLRIGTLQVTHGAGGDSLDILSVDGQRVSQSNIAARDLANELASLDPSLRPAHIVTPWPIAGDGFTTSGGNDDRIRIVFAPPESGGSSPAVEQSVGLAPAATSPATNPIDTSSPSADTSTSSDTTTPSTPPPDPSTQPSGGGGAPTTPPPDPSTQPSSGGAPTTPPPDPTTQPTGGSTPTTPPPDPTTQPSGGGAPTTPPPDPTTQPSGGGAPTTPPPDPTTQPTGGGAPTTPPPDPTTQSSGGGTPPTDPPPVSTPPPSGPPVDQQSGGGTQPPDPTTPPPDPSTPQGGGQPPDTATPSPTATPPAGGGAPPPEPVTTPPAAPPPAPTTPPPSPTTPPVTPGTPPPVSTPPPMGGTVPELSHQSIQLAAVAGGTPAAHSTFQFEVPQHQGSGGTDPRELLGSGSTGAGAFDPNAVGGLPDASDTYPGDNAGQAAIAAWMARQAHAAGLPAELPIMAALTESGLKNDNYGDRDSLGFFQMRTSIWNQGEYAGFPDHPELQLKWFINQALAVRSKEISEGNTTYGQDRSKWGDWVADVEQPAAEYRGRYQTHLDQADGLLGAGSASAPAALPAASGADPGQFSDALQAGAAQTGYSTAGLQALLIAEKYIGTPYHWGGDTPATGFDCSGLVEYSYSQLGIHLPRVAADQFNVGIPVTKDELKPGDIVFFKDSTGYVHHEGIYIGNDMFLEAPHTGDVVKISSLDTPYYAQQFAGGRDVSGLASTGAPPGADVPSAGVAPPPPPDAPAAPTAPAAPEAPAGDNQSGLFGAAGGSGSGGSGAGSDPPVDPSPAGPPGSGSTVQVFPAIPDPDK